MLCSNGKNEQFDVIMFTVCCVQPVVGVRRAPPASDKARRSPLPQGRGGVGPGNCFR